MPTPTYRAIDASTLAAACAQYADQTRTLRTGALPDDLTKLIAIYTALGSAVSTAEAALVGALDAVDPRTGLSNADQAPYRAVIPVAFQVLRDCGEVFARLDGSFSTLVHGGGGWPNRPIQSGTKTLYENTFKTKDNLSAEARQTAYQTRVDKFLAQGGDFADITLLDADRVRALKPWSHFDYVMLPNLETRVYPTAAEDRRGKPKAGHSLLVGTNAAFDDRPILSAGELWILKDYTDELEAVIIANNSGHFKPSFKDLPNTIPGLEALDIRPDQVVLFGGPNNIHAIFREIGEIHGVEGLDAKLPPDPLVLLNQWAQDV